MPSPLGAFDPVAGTVVIRSLRPVHSYDREHLDLREVRRLLRGLVEARLLAPLTSFEADLYVELCARERALLDEAS